MKRTLFLITVMVCCGGLSAQQTYSLEQILDSALHNNIAMRNARQEIDAAQQQRKEAFTKYFPNVSATGLWFNANKGTAEKTLYPSEMISPEMGAGLAQMFPAEALAALQNPVSLSLMKHGTVAGITAMQPVFAGGLIVNGNRLAKVGEDVSRLQLQLSENEVEKIAEQYFWQIVSLQEKMKTVAAVETMLADIHKDVDAAVSAGIALRNDLLQVQLRQNEVESQRLKLQNGISIVRLLLAQYCGLRDTSFTLSHHADAVIPVPLKQDHQQALFSTSEYQLLGKQVEAANLQRKMEIGKNLPTVAVGGRLQLPHIARKRPLLRYALRHCQRPYLRLVGRLTCHKTQENRLPAGARPTRRQRPTAHHPYAERLEQRSGSPSATRHSPAQHRAVGREPPPPPRLLPCRHLQDVRPPRSPASLPAVVRQAYRCLCRPTKQDS